MIRSTHTFTRGNGERVTVELTVDQQALALFMAKRLTRHGQRSVIKKIGGGAAVIRVVTPHPDVQPPPVKPPLTACQRCGRPFVTGERCYHCQPR